MLLGSYPDSANSASKYSDLIPSRKCLPSRILKCCLFFFAWFSPFTVSTFLTFSGYLLKLAMLLFNTTIVYYLQPSFIIQSNNIILNLPLVFFPFIIAWIVVLKRESPLIMWLNHFLCQLLITPVFLTHHL